MIRTYAVTVTEDLIPAIIEDAALFNLDVSDYIQDAMEFANENGEDLYAILSVNVGTKQATFTEMEGSGFHNNWRFTGAHHTRRAPWKTVALINPKR